MQALSTPGLADELARLRRRAYGPDADIASDREALDRLQELEELSRTEAAETAESTESEAEHGIDAIFESLSFDREPSPRAGGRLHPLAFWSSLAAAAGLAALVGLMIPHAVAPSADTTLRPVEVLDPSGATALMQRSLDLDLETPIVYESYDDLEVLSATNDAGLTCLLVSWANHWSDFSCTPAGLVPVVDYDAYLGSPILLDEPLPPGTVIRFELRGDAVEVTLSEPPKGRVSAGQIESGRVTSAKASLPSAA